MSQSPLIKNPNERGRASTSLNKVFLITFLFFTLFWACNLTSCSGGKDSGSEVAKTGQAKVVAVYTHPDGIKEIAIMLRVITKGVKYDSLNKKDIVAIDTVWGKPVLMDGKDSTGKPIKIQNYFIISKDSVNWHIEGRSVDSLLNK